MGELLTVNGIKNAKPKPGAKWAEERFDTGAPGMALRISPDGHKSFVWRGRIKGLRESIRVTIGPVPEGPGAAPSLKLARNQARKLYAQASDGQDPRLARRAKAAEAKNDFASVAEAFIAEHVSKLRSKARTEAEIRRYLINPWGKKPIASITPDDVAEVMKGLLDEGKSAMARLVLSHAKRLFRWAAAPARGVGRLKINPAAGLSARKDFDIVTAKRQIALAPEHLAAIWRAADEMQYPAGPYFKMLALSGQRRGEVAGLKWSELDLDRDKVWVIPAARMKAKRDHEVPLSPAMLTLLLDLRQTRNTAEKERPGATKGDYVFSTDGGARAIGNFSQLKSDLDKKIAELASDVEMPAWTIHDLRRTMRTGLGAIPAIPQDIRELVIAHVPNALVQTYDLHGYRDEKRQALTLWADRLEQIVNPPPIGTNVIAMRAAQ